MSLLCTQSTTLVETKFKNVRRFDPVDNMQKVVKIVTKVLKEEEKSPYYSEILLL